MFCTLFITLFSEQPIRVNIYLTYVYATWNDMGILKTKHFKGNKFKGYFIR